jgi:tRNA (cmo5U34)-methyltransferase
MGEQFHFDPATYIDMVTSEVPAYERLQQAVADATTGTASRVLDLGTGTGVTALRVLARHPGAELTGIDESAGMLDHARRALPAADLRVARLEDPLPAGPFDLIVSALAVHHLNGGGKAELFRRAALILIPGGRVIIGDVVVPDDPADVVTPVDGDYDRPSSVADQLVWLTDAGFRAYSPWAEGDLAVLVGELP